MERRMAQIEESVARYLQQLDSADRQEPSEALKAKTSRLKEKIVKLKEQMQRLTKLKVTMLATPDQQVSLTDPDARSMATSGRGSGVVGYNVQVAVDTAHHLIITHEVTNVGTDRSQLLQQRGDPGVRECGHNGHAAKADDLELKGARAFRQAGLPLCGAAGRLHLSCRRKARLPLHDRGKRIGPAPLLDQRLPELRHQAQLHHRQGATDHPMGT